MKQSGQDAPGFTRPPPLEVKQSDVFYTQLNALSTLRSIKTRRLAQAEDNPELAKVAKLAYVFKDLYNAVVTSKGSFPCQSNASCKNEKPCKKYFNFKTASILDERGEFLATPFTSLPTKRKLPNYYQRVAEPIDLQTIEQNINTGVYKTIEAFDHDMSRLFTNNVRFFGRTSDLGIAATRLRRIYCLAKLDAVVQLEQVLGENVPATFIPEKTDPGMKTNLPYKYQFFSNFHLFCQNYFRRRGRRRHSLRLWTIQGRRCYDPVREVFSLATLRLRQSRRQRGTLSVRALRA